MGRVLALSLLQISSIVFAWQVISIVPDGDGNKIVKIAHYGEAYAHWVISDGVCISREMIDEVVCGRVVSHDSVETIIKFPSEKVIFREKDEIKILYAKKKTPLRPPANEMAPMAVSAIAESKPRNLSLGLGSGFTYLFFTAQFKYAVSKKVSLGIMPLYINDRGVEAQVRAFGVFLTGEYYFNRYFYGLRIESGLGMYSVSGKTNTIAESFSPLAFYSTFGWRGKISSSDFTLGLAGGFQYVANTAKTIIVDFSGLLPYFTLDFGYSF